MKQMLRSVGAVVAALGTALPGWGQSDTAVQVGSLTLAPVASLAGAYDSNISRATSGERDDLFLDMTVGIKAGNRAEQIECDGVFFLSQRFYRDNESLDFGAGGETLAAKFGTPDRVAYRLQQSWRRVEDLDDYGPSASFGGIASDTFLDADARSRRDVHEMGAAVEAVLTDKTELGTSYQFRQTDYKSPGLLDQTGHGGQAELSYGVTDKSAVLLTLLGGLQDSQSVEDDARYTAARFGMRTRGTDRLTVKAGAGSLRYDRPGDADTENVFHYDATASWVVTDKTVVQLEGRNGMQLSSISQGNTVDFSTVRLGLACRATQALSLRSSAVYRIDDYEDPVPVGDGLAERKDKGTSLEFRVDYLLSSKSVRLFAKTTYEMVDSTVRDYDLTRALVGLELRD